MMKPFTLLALTLATIVAAHVPALAAEPSEEQKQIAVLVSSAPQQDKEAACARLKRIGTKDSVPALAMLLSDKHLSDPARDALELMSGPEVGPAFIKALDKTAGLQKIGVINSLGNRREPGAVAALSPLLGDSDTGVATAAAVALGKIATPKALKALKASMPGRDSTIHAALVEGLLTGAERTLASGDRSAAKAIFKSLDETEDQECVRAPAFAGYLRASGDKALKPLAAALVATDPARQAAALQVARELKVPKTTASLASALPKASPLVQAALLEVLSVRGDTAAAPEVLRLTESQDPNVRVAAIAALGALGDTSTLPVLTKFAISKDNQEQKAARQSLLELRHGQINEAMLAQMTEAGPAAQVELARALAGRDAQSTVPKLLELARSDAPGSRAAALRALPLLANPQHLPALVQLVQIAKTDDLRSESQEVLRSVCLRFQGDKSFDLGPVLEGVSKGGTEARIALLEVCGSLGGDRVRQALRAALQENNPALQAAARRTLCDTQDPELLPDILTMAKNATETNVRTLALRGYVRLACEEENAKLSPAQRAGLLQQGFAVANRTEEKRLILAALATVPAKEALDLVQPYFDSADLQTEAALAAIKIGGAIKTEHPESVRTAMNKVIAMTSDSARRTAAENLLKALEAKPASN